MPKFHFINSLSFKLTLAFLIAATSSVALVAFLAYQFTSSDLAAFTSHVQRMEQMMGGTMREMMGSMRKGMGQGMMSGLAFGDAAEEFQNSFSKALWLSGLSGAALAIVLGLLFTRQIVSPISKIRTAARIVSGGDLRHRVQVQGSDEIAELGRSFNYMAESLNKDRELRHQMLADIAHELRTPLFILQGNTEAMLEGVLPASKENLSTIHQETLLLSRLVEDLRTLSLAEVGQLKFQAEATDLKELSLKIADGFKAQAAVKKINLSVEAECSPGGCPPAWVDPSRTEQVIRNLLTNAFQYTPEGGKITIKITPEGDMITLCVTDTGSGISPEDLPRVFGRFFRVDRSRTRGTGGSGLGLSIVKQLVEGQGGEVRAESTPGKGSTFSLTVPAARM